LYAGSRSAERESTAEDQEIALVGETCPGNPNGRHPPIQGFDMLRSFKLGRAFGIPLFLHSTFLLLPLWFLYLSRHDGPVGILFGQVVLLSLFACVLLHELGHALAARYFGIATRDITLYPIGGVARLESTGNRPNEELWIALAGPAVNLAIVLLLSPLVALAGLFHAPAEVLSGPVEGLAALAGSYFAALWLGNIALLLFNLIPVFPMDGGRVLRALLAMRMPHLRATEVAATVGLFGAGALAFVGLMWNPSLVLVSVFVAFAGQQELAALRRREVERRMEVEVLPVVEAPVHPQLAGFTGFLWDRDNRTWVRWVNGRPAETN
jgi:Zn-dependent protease